MPDSVGAPLPIPRIVGLTETTSSPRDLVITSLEISDKQKKAAIQDSIRNQYLLAAEQGRISRIRAFRVHRRLDQVELARLAGMTQPEISRAERLGQAGRMKAATLQRIARALNVRVDDLL